MNKANCKYTVVAALSAVLAVSATAQAQAQSATTIIDDYNEVVFGNLTQNSEVDGKVFVGGNLTGGGNYDGHNVEASSLPALTVGGSVSGSVNLNGVGGLAAGSLTTSSINNNGGGDIYVSGNVTGLKNFSVQNGSKTKPYNFYIEGNLVNSSISVNNQYNNLYVGGTSTGSTVNKNGSAIYQTGSSVPATVVPSFVPSASTIKSMQTTIENYSTQLAGLATTGSSYTDKNNTILFNADPNSKGVAVLDISGAAELAQLNSATQFEYSLNGAKEFIINVTGVGSSSLNIKANFIGDNSGVTSVTSLGTDTVWNFSDAKGSITFGTQFGGSVLASLANVTVNGDIEGTLIANNVTQNSEVHYDGANTGLVSPVPLPGALPLFGVSLLGVFGFGVRSSRRRRDA